MALINRFTTTTRGAITFTGNTLGLSKDDDSNDAGTDDSIGAFISLTQGPLPTYPTPPGTTLDFTQNESQAVLNIPVGSTVLYAELIWGGTYISSFSSVDNSAFINNSVKFTTPSGTFAVAPDPVTANEFVFTNDAWYTRSAEVTALVQAGGSGVYSAGNITGTVDPLNNQSNCAGWTLAVIYANPSMPIRNMTFYTGGEYLEAGASADTTITGFITSPIGPVSGRVFVSTQEGDASFFGDQLLFGPTVGTLANLSGPNNPVDNFFASQINNADPTSPNVGLIDTTGSFGTFNHDAITGTNVFAGRQGWDITSVDISAQLTTSQSSAVLRFTTQGDRFLTNGFAIMVDSLAPVLELNKTVDKTVAAVGDTLTYTITIENTGDIDADNVIITDSIPLTAAYVPGTFTVDGFPQAGDPNAGINIGTVLVGQTRIVQFDVLINALPLVNPMPNQASVTYQFEPTPGTIIEENAASNEVTTQIEELGLSIVKSADKAFAEVGESITYSIVLTNTGTVDLINMFFQDTVPNGSTFVPGTLLVGGLPNLGDPNTGIIIGALLPGVPLTVEFQVLVTSSPVPNPMVNTANVTYDYQLSPLSPIEQGSGVSNSVETLIEEIAIEAVKSVDKAVAEVGDILTYTTLITNTTLVELTNIVFTDADPAGTVFVPGSVKVGGFPNLTANPNAGFLVGSLQPGESVAVVYEVEVAAVPQINPTTNIAEVEYNYTLGPGQPTRTGEQDTNAVTTQIEQVEVSLLKTADVTTALVGDTIIYTVDINNTGTVDLENVIFTDPVQPETSFIPGSVLINGGASAGDPNIGINVGTVSAGASTTVQFSVTVDAIPANGLVLNTANINYDVVIDPNLPPDNRDASSDETQVEVLALEASLIKAVNKEYAQVGEEVTFTSTISNNGDIPLLNVVFTDAIPAGTSLVPNSLTIDNVVQPGADPSIPLNLGTLMPGQQVVISYRVTIDMLPVPPVVRNTATVDYDYQLNPQDPIESVTLDSNETATQVVNGQLQVEKYANKNAVLVGDALIYNIIVTNTGNVTLNDVVVTDLIPAEASFMPGTILVGGVARMDEDPNTGINLGSIAAGEVVVINFSVTVNSLPVTGQLENTASAAFTFIVDPNEPPVQSSVLSNTVITQVELILLQFIKSSDKSSVALGETLTYNFLIINNGSLPVDNVVFSDEIPVGTQFVQNSLTIAGVPMPGADPTVGVNIGTIPSNSSLALSFAVELTVVPCPPVLVNSGSISYQYQLESSGPIVTGQLSSNSIDTFINTASFKQLFVDQTLTIPEAKPDMESLIDMTVEVLTCHKQLIDTPKGISNEGQVLTGKKLLISGRLEQVIEYVADNPEQSVHSAHFEVPFCTFIVMPETLNDVCQINITPFIEDVYYRQINSRQLFSNVTFRLETGI